MKTSKKWIIPILLGVVLIANINNEASWSNALLGFIAIALIIFGLLELSDSKKR